MDSLKLVNQYFSRDYTEARQNFLAAANRAGATIETFRNPHSLSAQVPLLTDVATLGPADAEISCS
jgi:hypothetical protein